MREKLRLIVEDNTTRSGKIFDYIIQFLIFFSLISYAVETLPGISPELFETLHFLDVLIVILFSIEYLLRIYVAENRIKYIFSFFGIIDLLAVLPFYLHATFDLRSIRAFRVFRLFRALKLIRYNKALHRFYVAAKMVQEEMILFFIVSAILVFLTSSGIYHFEHIAQPDIYSSIFHSFWWAIVTLTTVGYGDVVPITLGGKIFTFFVLIIGVCLVSIPAGLIATGLIKARKIEDDENDQESLKK